MPGLRLAWPRWNLKGPRSSGAGLLFSGLTFRDWGDLFLVPRHDPLAALVAAVAIQEFDQARVPRPNRAKHLHLAL